MYNLTDINTVKGLLKKHNFHFSKSLGQNFLVDSDVPIHIAEQAGIDENTGVIEIGPGMGTLTVELAKHAKKVVAIEIDKALVPVLADTLSDFNNIKVIIADVLKTDLNALIKEEFNGMDVVVCANLPYYITTPVIMYLLESKVNVKSITVMVQKEVAERLCANADTKEYGAITLAIAYYTKAEIMFAVNPSSFIPAPKVYSSVIKMQILEKTPVSVVSEKLLFSIIKAAFSQRRKTLCNALSNTLPQYKKEFVISVIKKCGFSDNIRGEALNLEQFAILTNELCKNI